MPELKDPQIFAAVLDSLATGVYLVGRDRKIVFWNRGAEQITGYQRHDVVGHLSRDNILAQCNEASCVLCGASCPLTAAIHDGKAVEAQIFLRHREGHSVPVHLRVVPIRDANNSLVGAAESFFEQREATVIDLHQGNLAAHGCLDALTGVPNHAFTESHLQENLAFFEKHKLGFGVLRIAIEDLGRLQTTHGREAVGVMMHVLAQTLKHTLRPDGVLGRWGEQEFIGLVTYCDPAELAHLAENVQKMSGCTAIQWWDDLISVKVSVGSAMVQAGDTVETLLQRAAPKTNTVAAAQAGGAV